MQGSLACYVKANINGSNPFLSAMQKRVRVAEDKPGKSGLGIFGQCYNGTLCLERQCVLLGSFGEKWEM